MKASGRSDGVSDAVTIRAHAKINLSLRVLGRRADGYHELKTLFQTLALHDTLRLDRTTGPLTVTCTDPAVPCDRRNLVVRAASLLWEAIGRSGDPGGVSIALTKRIPAQGGLGGGSSDGASALRGLAELWQVALPGPALVELARQLGADVPFFLTGGSALGLGRGDDIYPLEDRPRRWAVLVVPPYGIPTPDAFRWVDESRLARADEMLDLPADIGRNDLEGFVAGRHPEIADLAAILRSAGAEVAAMSGSGSTVFGLFESPRAAGAARARLVRRGWRALVTRTLSRAEHEASVRPAAFGGARGRGVLVGSRMSRVH